MADPLSVAGLALAVVSLGLQVTAGITDFFDSLKSRDQDITSIIQQNDTLRKTLQIIESSISRFQNDHRTATDALRQFLDSCNEELKVLESMVATLNTCDQGIVGRRTKARNNGKKLLYPFHRPKLEQMATKLHRINSTLQLGLQSLGLSVSHSGSEKLAVLQATSQTISSDLLLVRSEVSAISTPVQGIQSTVSQFETRFDGLETLLQQLLVQGSTINGTLQEITPSVMAGRLISKPAVLQEMCNAVENKDRHRPMGTLTQSVPPQNARPTNRPLLSYRGRFSCLCHYRRNRHRKIAVWGSFSYSHEIMTEQHAPKCPATEEMLETDRSQKFALTYSGLRSLLNLAIQLSFTIRSGAGGSSFGPKFTYYPIVDSKSAPAFRMMSLLTISRNTIFNFYEKCNLLENRAWQEELLPSVVSSILRLFQTKQASPRAVNECNESLIYRVALCIRYCYNVIDLPQRRAETSQASPLLYLLEYLLNNKALANDYNTSGDTPLSAMLGLHSYGSVTHPVPAAAADLILRSNIDSAAVDQRGPYFPLGWKLAKVAGQVIWAPSAEVQLRFLSCSTRIADAYGCGPLSWAILSNNLEEVKLLIAKHPSTISETNLFGHSPLHLAADKPSILRVLVGVADTALLNWTDYGRSSALDFAVSLSGTSCRERGTGMCKRCRCAECAVILLKADCIIQATAASLGRILDRASKRCKLRYLRHLKDRTDRLKRFALENLSKTDTEPLGLRSEHVLDSNTFRVTQLLQKRGVCVPEALTMVKSGCWSYPWSVYQQLESSDDADICFRVGFRNTAWWYNGYELGEWARSCRQSLSYLRWLANHGGICCQLPFPTAKDIFGSACIFSAMGSEIKDSWTRSCTRYGQSITLPASPTIDPESEDWYHEVHSAVFEARNVDSCSCQCSPGGCNMLTWILGELINERDYKYKPRRYPRDHTMTDAEDSEQGTMNSTEPPESSVLEESPLLELIDGYVIYLSHFSCHFRRWHHYATIRFITFAALGIRHSCCRRDNVHRMFEDDLDNDEDDLDNDEDDLDNDEDDLDSDEDDLEDNQGYKMALLEDLINEFEKTITSILEDADTETHELMEFWEQTWVGRMSDVLDHLEGSDLPEDEKLAAEEIGIVWDRVGPEPPESGPKEMGNPYQRDMIEYWLYELRKIEEECQ